MSIHPETYYDAKRAVLAAVEGRTFGIQDRFRAGPQLDAVLDALGWPVPGPVMDGKRAVKVYRADVRYRVPEDIREGMLDGKGRGYNVHLPGFVVAPTKKAAADLLVPSFVRSRRTEGISEVDPSDYRYLLAVEHPEHVVLTADGTEFGEPVLVPRSEMKVQ